MNIITKKISIDDFIEKYPGSVNQALIELSISLHEEKNGNGCIAELKPSDGNIKYQCDITKEDIADIFKKYGLDHSDHIPPVDDE